MLIALTIIHVLMCIAIIGVVLIQSGKGADIGSAFGGAGSQAVFGSMGTPTVLTKLTAGVAVLFTITSFTLALLAGGERGTSVIREQPAPASQAPAKTPPASQAPTTTTPASPAPAPAPAEKSK